MISADTPSPARRTFSLLLLASVIPFLAASSRAQLAHEYPADAIALSQTVHPYNAVSIQQNTTGAQSGSLNIDDHGVFTASNMPLEAIIELSYGIRPDLILGLSGPVSSARFDITARVTQPDSVTPRMLPDVNLRAMVILLLADRFHLKAHLEPRTLPVYDLVVAPSGPKIELSPDAIHVSSWNINTENDSKVLIGKSGSMTSLADELSDEVHRQVVDKTGLAGSADITLKWTDEAATGQGASNVVSIFTALEEQLGLKLQPSKGSVDTLVIDHAEMPSEN